MRLAFQTTQKVGQKKVPSYVSNESSSEILVLWPWVEMKISGKNGQFRSIFLGQEFLEAGG